MTEQEKAYYDQRASEYDDWYNGTGLFATRDRPGWHEEMLSLRAILGKLPYRRILDIACGTGFLGRHLPGKAIGLDQSYNMLRVAQSRLSSGEVVRGDAYHLPFRDDAFECAVVGHFYGHVRTDVRAQFLFEFRRVASHQVIIDAALRADVQPEEIQERVLIDGSRHQVYKRFFTPQELISELGSGTVLHSGRWFVAVMS
jgi:demethylmenaquinone methyltransferase/2-methoxy-6-polyprenyl-1,4-benzoquinol methylase